MYSTVYKKKTIPEWHYYESHITLDPVFDERLDKLKDLCKRLKFNVADLLMRKRVVDTPERSKYDSFCTGRSDEYQDICIRTILMIQKLQEEGFNVRRYKVESTEVDSRYEDKFNLLGE